MDDETLGEIADELRARNLEVRALGYAGIATMAPVWSIVDPVEDVVIRVMVTPDANGNPQFWTEAFSSTNAEYVCATIKKLGDVANEVLVRQACRRRNEWATARPA
ncbi:hypothetical protein [Pseudomonas sp.]|uniref:hypothetical protein n=1 Tax=Pseudomonas sp. TaxID=306 RepID=UPI003D09A2A2